MPVLLVLDFVVLATVACYYIVKVYKKDVVRFHVLFAIGAAVLFIISALLLERLAINLNSVSLFKETLVSYAIYISAYSFGYLAIILIKHGKVRRILKALFIIALVWHVCGTLMLVYKGPYKNTVYCKPKDDFTVPGGQNPSANSLFWQRVISNYIVQNKNCN